MNEKMPFFTSPSLIKENCKGYNIVGYTDMYYGIPLSLGPIDLTKKQDRKRPGILSAKKQAKLEAIIDKVVTSKIQTTQSPLLVKQDYHGYNVVYYTDMYYGIPLSLGPIDLTKKQDRKRPGILTGKTQGALERLIDKPVEQLPPLTSSFHFLIEEGYKGYNIIAYGGKYYALAQAEGAFDIVKFKNRSYKRAFEGNSVNRVKFFVNTRCQLGKLRKILTAGLKKKT